MKLIYILLLGGLITACVKSKPDFQEERPGDYYPAYPGSYWIYNTGEHVMVAAEYEHARLYKSRRKTHPNDHQFECIFQEEGLYPRIGPKAYLKKYTLYNTTPSGQCGSSILLSEQPGFDITTDGHRYGSRGILVKAIDTTVVLPNGDRYDSVICMRTWARGHEFPNIVETYYAKHVGLIGVYQVKFGVEHINEWRKYLEHYEINRP